MLEGAPKVITRFLDAASERNYDALAECFTSDAAVSDERRVHRGRAEIRLWQEESRAKWEYAATAIDGRPGAADEYIVAVHLKGNFPGGEADVEYRFTIRDGLISSLRIG